MPFFSLVPEAASPFPNRRNNEGQEKLPLSQKCKKILNRINTSKKVALLNGWH
jgi:hypothetical protein